MTLFFAEGSSTTCFSDEELSSSLKAVLGTLGLRKKVLAVPPDFTRFESRAGLLTCATHSHYGEKLVDVMPALGTHFPMSGEQLSEMFPSIPKSLFRPHNWRADVTTLGELPAEFVKSTTNGLYDKPWQAQMNNLVASGGHDLILSIGQVVPHEVMGMANYNKNLFIGTGGPRGINESHFISAVCGIENILGRADNPLRRLLNAAEERFCQELPIVYVLTVVGATENGGSVVRGLYVGDDVECFKKASELAREVCFQFIDKPVQKMVAYLDPHEFHSTWLGNKSIYRTRMAIADGGELIVLAPGIKTFGEDPEIDRLIRKYGYRTTPEVMQLVDDNQELQDNLGTAAHLMHSTPENRFKVTYCPGHLTQEDVEQVGFEFGDLKLFEELYPVDKLADGWNTDSKGEEFYFVRKPALGLWAHRSRFEE